MDAAAGGMTAGDVMQLLSWFLFLGTVGFVLLALHEKSFLLAMGCTACIVFDLMFAQLLYAQRTGGANETLVTLYLCLAASAAYALAEQFSMFREQGCGCGDEEEEDGEEEEEEDENRAAAEGAQGAAAGEQRITTAARGGAVSEGGGGGGGAALPLSTGGGTRLRR